MSETDCGSGDLWDQMMHSVRSQSIQLPGGPFWFQSTPRESLRQHIGNIVWNPLWLRQGSRYHRQSHCLKHSFPSLEHYLKITGTEHHVSLLQITGMFHRKAVKSPQPFELEGQKTLLLTLSGDFLVCL